MNFETISIHGGKRLDTAYNSLTVPIYQTSTFVFEDIGKTKGFDYSRSGNPTRKVLEDTIAQLEGGSAGFAFATGMAAEATVIHLLKSGDHVISCDDVYGGTYRLFEDIMKNHGLEFTFVRMTSGEAIEKAIQPNTKMLWIETPSNPLLTIVDLKMVAEIAGKYGLITVIDNTFASPYFQRPLEFGIDVVIHSTTKYLNGHCDVVGGAVVTNDEGIAEKVKFLQNGLGTCAAPFDCWLVLRGIETLAIRMKKHEENAIAIANFLSNHRAIDKVYFPGLPSHNGYDIAVKQMTGFGGMVSCELNHGINMNNFLKGVKIFSLAESLGGAASLIEHPYTMSHASMPDHIKQKVGITQSLIRLSIGLENVNDLIDDLSTALNKAW